MPPCIELHAPDTYYEYLFQATWQASSGSGSGLTVSEAEELPWPRLTWWVDRIGDQRRAEAAAQRRAEEAAKSRR